MAIRLHPEVFRRIAGWQPGPQMLMDSGGITVPTLRVLHAFACHELGYEPGSAALVLAQGAPSTYLFFGNSVDAGLGVEGATYTDVRLGDNEPVALLHVPPCPAHPHGLHRLEDPLGGGSSCPFELTARSKDYEDLFSAELSERALRFLS